LKRISLLIWKQYYYELCYEKKYEEALNILNNNIQDLIDMTNTAQKNEFKELSKHLIPNLSLKLIKDVKKNQVIKMRVTLYEEIIKFMPSDKAI